MRCYLFLIIFLVISVSKNIIGDLISIKKGYYHDRGDNTYRVFVITDENIYFSDLDRIEFDELYKIYKSSMTAGEFYIQ